MNRQRNPPTFAKRIAVAVGSWTAGTLVTYLLVGADNVRMLAVPLLIGAVAVPLLMIVLRHIFDPFQVRFSMLGLLIATTLVAVVLGLAVWVAR